MIETSAPRQVAEASSECIEIGEIKAAYGIKGWVKVFSYTRPIEQIFSYKCWLLGKNAEQCQLQDYTQRSNSGLIAKIEGVDDRTAALTLIGKTISIHQNELAELDGEYYWSQLIGLRVFSATGDYLGKLSEMIETGAHDVMCVKNEQGEQLIPYAKSIVQSVNIDENRLFVDWETDE